MIDQVNLLEVLKGLKTEYRKAKDNEICVYLTSAFAPELHVGVRGIDTRVLTPEASMTLLERLNAELRVPRKGDRVLRESGKWGVAAFDFSVYAICEKKPVEPEFRKLEPGEPVMPGDRLHGFRGEDIGEACNHYRDERPFVNGMCAVLYSRKPWTPEEYLKRQAEWVEFHNLKPGDTVKVCCKAKTDQDGWPEYWVEDMELAIGEEFKVKDIQSGGIQSVSDKFIYPFYVLQVVKKPVKPEPKYREFRTPQEVLAWVQAHGQIVVDAKGNWNTVTRSEIGTSGLILIPYNLASLDTWEHWKSAKDGTPLGVLE